ncbi:hypothetical protein V8B97DRAFT_1853026, partial [Scleroderma yunnanense]
MYLINVKTFMEREQAMSKGEVDCGTKVLEFHDNNTTDYAILSHRWMEPQLEVNYKEMVKLARMEKQEQKKVRECLGYKKIFSSCEQTKRDGYDWLWVDTCCID